MAVKLTRRPFDVDEYHRMGEVGILTAEDRVELIDGEIVQLSPIGAPHARCVMFLTEAFVRRLEGRAVVSPQNSVRLHRRTEPQPDIILLKPPLARYATAIPGPGDTHLVVEVAQTSQYHDRVVKLPRYAAADVPEVWIVDLDARVIDTYRGPAPKGIPNGAAPDAGRRCRSRRVPRRSPFRHRRPRLTTRRLSVGTSSTAKAEWSRSRSLSPLGTLQRPECHSAVHYAGRFAASPAHRHRVTTDTETCRR